MHKQIRRTNSLLIFPVIVLLIGLAGIGAYFVLPNLIPNFSYSLYVLIGGIVVAIIGLLLLILKINSNRKTGIDVVNRELLYFKNGKLKARLHPEDIKGIEIKNSNGKTGIIIIHTTSQIYKFGKASNITEAATILSAFRKWTPEPIKTRKKATVPGPVAKAEKPTRKEEKKAKAVFEERSGEKLGDAFEDEIYSILQGRSAIPSYHKALKGLYVESTNGRVTEIDEVALTRNGIYVIECKDYSGTIIGSINDHDWTVVYDNGEKHTLYNPIMQNNGHVTALSHVLHLPRDVFRSVIILSGYSNLNGTTYAEDNVTILSNPEIAKGMRNMPEPKNPVLSKEEIDRYYAILEPMTKASYSVRLKHLEQVEAKKGESY